PRLYSKARANAELRKMLNISAKEAPKDITQLSDQELIARLAQQARELGVEINLDYHFARQPPATELNREENQLIDIASESDTPHKRERWERFLCQLPREGKAARLDTGTAC